MCGSTHTQSHFITDLAKHGARCENSVRSVFVFWIYCAVGEPMSEVF